MQKRPLIFFDLDHTLVNANSSFRFGIFLYRQGKLPFFSMVKLVLHYLEYKRGRASLSTLHTNVFNSFFCGLSSSEIVSSAIRFWDLHFNSLIDEKMVQKVVALQKEGGIAVILSSSPDFLVGEFAKRLNINHYHATPYKTDSAGNFHKIPFVMDGFCKAGLVKTLALEYSIPLDQTVGYSDSIDDLLFLEAVGTPVAVNPDRALRAYAHLRNWTIK